MTLDAKASLQRAGLRVGGIRPFQWSKPVEVQIRRNNLEWQPDTTGDWVNLPKTTPLIMRFAGLRDASDTRIASFAQEYGVLELCQAHRLPDTHTGTIASFATGFHTGLCRPKLRKDSQRPWSWTVEPLALWRQLAKDADNVLTLGANLQRNQLLTGDPRWAELGHYLNLDPWVPGKSFGRQRDPRANAIFSDVSSGTVTSPLLTLRERHRIARVVKTWLGWAGIAPTFFWDDAPELVTGARSLFGQLALELALALINEAGWYTCSACGKSFERSTSPKPGTRISCGRPECDAELARLRQQDRRKRQRQIDG